MGNSPTPPGLLERILLEVDKRIAAFARSGFLRNAMITQGGITVRNGFLRVQNALGTVTQFFVGGVTPARPDGSLQPGLILCREDGTTAMALYDPIPGPTDADFKQFLAIYDRAGNIILGDDTDSGQGVARPYVPFAFYISRSADWPVVTGTTFETVYRARGPKQQPKLYVVAWLNATGAGAVAEMRVLVNGAVWDVPRQSSPGFVTELVFGPLSVGGGHMSQLSIEIQARLVSGTGNVQVGVARVEGRQS